MTCDSNVSNSFFKSFKSSRRIRRKIRKFFSRQKSLKIRKRFLEFQKYFLVCFIGNSKERMDLPNKRDLFLLFKACMNSVFYDTREFYALICLWFLNLLRRLLSIIFKVYACRPVLSCIYGCYDCGWFSANVSE